jgi:carbon monoxide dehydrogenase subunit G
MHIEESIEVEAPREEVWKFVSQPERYEEFMFGSHWATVNGEPTSGPRARFRISIEVRSIDLGGLVEIVEWDPPHELTWTSITGIDQRGRWILRDCPIGTRASIRASYQVPGGVLALMASRLSKPLIRRDLRRSVAALKESVEGGPT